MLNKRLRSLLHAHGPMTVGQLHALLGSSTPTNIRQTLRAMPDTYIERWSPSKNGRPSAVWAAIKRPTNCPPPKKKTTP